MNTIFIRPISREEAIKTYTTKNSLVPDFSLLQIVPANFRPPIDITVKGDASGKIIPSEGASTYEEVMKHIYAKDPERKERDIAFQERILAGLENQVKVGTLNPIRFARMKARMDQRELARRIGTSASHLVRIEKIGANPRLKTLKKIASALSIPIEELVRG